MDKTTKPKKEIKEPFKVTRLSVTPIISYQLNNLATSDLFMAYQNSAGAPRIVVYPVNDKELGEPFIIKEVSQDPDGRHLIHKHIKVLQQGHFGEPLTFFNCSAHISCLNKQEGICFGTTNCELYFCQQKSENQFDVTVGLSFTTKKIEVTCLTSSKEYSWLVVGDTLGQVHIFMLDGLKQIDSTSHESPITTMKILQRNQQNQELSNLLIFGDFIGRIVIYDLQDFYTVAQINTHVRMITSLDCSEKKNEIVSGSEDTYLNVWRIDNNNEVHLKVSYRLADQIVMGIQYLKGNEQNIYVSCLEAGEITFLQSNN